jgi:Fe-S cluster assembly ATPase SufC
MPIKSFNIPNIKKIREASCDNVPKFMVIAGPNGVGKSTLLYELRRFSDKVKGTGKILYAGPHRAWRRRTIKASWLWGAETNYSSILTSESIPGFDWVRLPDPSRRPDSTDEAPGFIKYALAQIETRRQNVIVSEIDENDLKYPDGYAADVYKPLKNLIESLLPQMRFTGIDLRNRDNVRCLLQVEGVSELIDIDDLSSGEKEVIALLMPLIEREINAVLRRMEKGKAPEPEAVPDTVMVIDEPDLHIHSLLQKRMVDYMRKRAHEDNVQFIIATHSPVIINEANSEELFVLIERSIAGNDNQLRKVLSSQEKLDLYKNVCGDVAILTLGRPIVFIEGKGPEETRKAPSDQRILELLWDGAKDFTFIPIGGREEVEKTTIIMNQIITERLVGFPVFAIVDTDLGIPTTTPSSILNWEFCTIENVLLDPQSMFEVLEPYREKTGVSCKEDVENELMTICKEMAQDEINKRVERTLPSFHLHFKGRSIDKLIEERDTGAETMKQYFTNQNENEMLSQQIQKIVQDVGVMVQDRTALTKFSGKEILRKFHHKKVSEKGIVMGFDVFCYAIAEKIDKGGRTPKSIKKVLASIKEHIENVRPKNSS